jgi:hypothetical protein
LWYSGDTHDWLHWAKSYHKRYVLCRQTEKGGANWPNAVCS